MPHATIAPARKNRVRRLAPARAGVSAGAGAGAVRLALAPAPALAPARTVLPLWQALLPGGGATTAGARP
ncbi:hypothetical protein ACFWDQ_26850 [Streptomyces sp. NPDC060053]|uniref:hypothetical protein n=1 Tax=Streptomyces sp. NPDC060053 TaxID=3347047 RepID=UPI003691C3B3